MDDNYSKALKIVESKADSTSFDPEENSCIFVPDLKNEEWHFINFDESQAAEIRKNGFVKIETGTIYESNYYAAKQYFKKVLKYKVPNEKSAIQCFLAGVKYGEYKKIA